MGLQREGSPTPSLIQKTAKARGITINPVVLVSPTLELGAKYATEHVNGILLAQKVINGVTNNFENMALRVVTQPVRELVQQYEHAVADIIQQRLPSREEKDRTEAVVQALLENPEAVKQFTRFATFAGPFLDAINKLTGEMLDIEFLDGLSLLDYHVKVQDKFPVMRRARERGDITDGQRTENVRTVHIQPDEDKVHRGISSILHEANTPITALIGQVQFSQMKLKNLTPRAALTVYTSALAIFKSNKRYNVMIESLPELLSFEYPPEKLLLPVVSQNLTDAFITPLLHEGVKITHSPLPAGSQVHMEWNTQLIEKIFAEMAKNEVRVFTERDAEIGENQARMRGREVDIVEQVVGLAEAHDILFKPVYDSETQFGEPLGIGIHPDVEQMLRQNSPFPSEQKFYVLKFTDNGISLKKEIAEKGFTMGRTGYGEGIAVKGKGDGISLLSEQAQQQFKVFIKPMPRTDEVGTIIYIIVPVMSANAPSISRNEAPTAELDSR